MGNAKLRVVLADDNPKWVYTLVSLLGTKCEVLATAIDGYSALQYISYLKPDVAVLDLEMRGLNGLEVTQELMKNGRKPPVVICSAYATQDFVEAAREAGALGYVFKHCCTRDLLPAVEAASSGLLSFPPRL